MRTVAVVCVITASAFIGPPVWASLCVLDQFQEEQDYSYNVGGGTLMAQTFTPDWPGALDYALLCHIEIGNTSGVIYESPVSPLVQIQEGLPGSKVLGSVPLPSPVPYNGWTLPTDIDFLAQGIVLTRGEMYSIVLGASDLTNTIGVGATPYESYPDGALWANYEGNWLLSETDIGVYDMQFRTYVVPVPLPAGVWLGICAVSVAGWHLKRQKG
jgi:hypothetical protein